ncbi:MAG: hypothetical protein U0638_10835 [Phycisphaerales bacterium]
MTRYITANARAAKRSRSPEKPASHEAIPGVESSSMKTPGRLSARGLMIAALLLIACGLVGFGMYLAVRRPSIMERAEMYLKDPATFARSSRRNVILQAEAPVPSNAVSLNDVWVIWPFDREMPHSKDLSVLRGGVALNGGSIELAVLQPTSREAEADERGYWIEMAITSDGHDYSGLDRICERWQKSIASDMIRWQREWTAISPEIIEDGSTGEARLSRYFALLQKSIALGEAAEPIYTVEGGDRHVVLLIGSGSEDAGDETRASVSITSDSEDRCWQVVFFARANREQMRQPLIEIAKAMAHKPPQPK